MKKDDLLLYAITDRAWLKDDETLPNQVEKAILGGATIVQLREKHLEKNELKALALDVQKVCKKYNVPFIINDDVELAKEIDADGVHVGQQDMSVLEARRILGAQKIVGATAKTIEQAKLAMDNGADYLGSGALFGSFTKTDAKPMEISFFNEICKSVEIPVVAIGGISMSNIDKLKNTYMAGVAVVSAIFAASDITEATKELKDKVTTLIEM